MSSDLALGSSVSPKIESKKTSLKDGSGLLKQADKDSAKALEGTPDKKVGKELSKQITREALNSVFMGPTGKLVSKEI